MDDVFTVLDEKLLHCGAKFIGCIAGKSGRFHKVGVYMVSEHVSRSNAHANLGSFRYFSHHKSKIVNRILDSSLQLLEMSPSVLNTNQRHKQPQYVIGSLKDPEDSEI